MHSQAVVRFPFMTVTRSQYEGEWAAGRKHGRGTQWVKKGGELQKRYAGDWYAGKRHGFGVFFFDNGDRFEGEFVEGKRNGQGTMAFADGSVYEGHWEAGLRSGVGVLTTAGGDAYEGHWEHDVKHGPGRLFYRRTRKMYEGEWVDGAPKCGVFSAIPDASGTAEAPEDDDFVLPELALRDPDAVIMDAVAEARSAAAAARGDAQEPGDLTGAHAAAHGEAGTHGDFAPAPGGEADAWPVDALSEDELGELWTAFASAPGGITDDRCIAAESLGPVLRELGLMPTDDDIARILRLSGVDSDGVLSFDAFAAVMASLRQ